MSRYRLNRGRAERVGEAFRSLGLEAVLRLEEMDPQFTAVSEVARSVGPGPAAVAAMLVALASFRLAMRGEEWWMCFSRLVPGFMGDRPTVESAYEAAKKFISTCEGGAIGREAKIKRISRAWMGGYTLFRSIAEDPSIIIRDPDGVADRLKRALNERRLTKTVVFAVKMGYYAARYASGRKPLNSTIPIPVDVRVACLTYSSMMVDGPGYRGLVSDPTEAHRAWEIVSEVSGIPQIHLDTVAWLTGWAPRDLPLEEARSRIRDVIERVASPVIASRVASELCLRTC